MTTHTYIRTFCASNLESIPANTLMSLINVQSLITGQGNKVPKKNKRTGLKRSENNRSGVVFSEDM